MRKFYLVSILIIFFSNCAMSQNSSDENGFDGDRKVQDLKENELIYDLKELEEDALQSSLPPVTNSVFDSELLDFEDLDSLVEESGIDEKPEQSPPVKPISSEEKENPKSPTPAPNQQQLVQKNIQPVVRLRDEQVSRLEKIKDLYKKGEFYKISKEILQDDEHESLYYQALAMYNIIRKNKKFEGNLSSSQKVEKRNITEEAKENLYQVGTQSPDPSLKEKAILWYGILSIMYPKNYRDEKEVTDSFLYIEEEMRNSNVYNDALLYLTMIYKKLGKTEKAKEYYRKSLRTSPSDLVYNYKTDTLVPAKNLWELFKDLNQ